MEWWDILDVWHREFRCADNLSETVFSSKLMKHLNSQSLASGFRVCIIFSSERHEVLKQLPSANATGDVNKFFFNQFVLEVLKIKKQLWYYW